jgi:hypothetical protein
MAIGSRKVVFDSLMIKTIAWMKYMIILK